MSVDRITIFNADGKLREVHVLPRNSSTFGYAGNLVRRQGRDFLYEIEVAGQKSQRFNADEILAREALEKRFG